jgi:hypothetical protein
MLDFSDRVLPQVRRTLRETGTEFDSEIKSYIQACISDLKNAGILSSFFTTGEVDPQILQAVRYYCLSNYGLYNADSEKYDKSYRSLKSTLCTQGYYTEEH